MIVHGGALERARGLDLGIDDVISFRGDVNNMNLFEWAVQLSSMRLDRKSVVVALLPLALVSVAWPQNSLANPNVDGAAQTSQTALSTSPEVQNKWQAGTVIAVQPHRAPNANPSLGSYDVSIRVGDTVYVVLHTPHPGTDIGQYAIGRELTVLIGEDTLTYNSVLGQSHRVPILSRTDCRSAGKSVNCTRDAFPHTR